MKLFAARSGASLFVILAAAACVPRGAVPPPVEAPPAPVARPAPAPAPAQAPASASWMDAPATPGDWSYRSITGGGGIASFGTAGSALFSMACERDSRAIVLTRGGAGQRAGSGRMIVRTESQTRTLTAAAGGTGVMARLPASDRLLDAMALSKGRFAIEVDGQSPLYVPSWAEVSRVIEDCR